MECLLLINIFVPLHCSGSPDLRDIEQRIMNNILERLARDRSRSRSSSRVRDRSTSRERSSRSPRATTPPVLQNPPPVSEQPWYI